MPESAFSDVCRKARWLHSAARWFGFGLVAWLLVETALRVAGFGDPPLYVLDPEIEYYLVPSKEYQRFGSRIRVNALGLRGNEIAPQSDHAVRVLLLGDSIVHGTHRVDQVDALPIVLEAELARRTRCAIEVAPIAVSSWGPVNQAAFLHRFGHFGAHVVVWILSSHDLHDVPIPGYAEALPRDPRIRVSAIADAMLMVRQKLVERVAPTVPLDVAESSTRRAMSEILTYFNAHGVPVIVAQHLTSDELVQGPHPAHKVIAELVGAQVPLVQLGPSLRSAAAALPNANYADSIHLSKAGVKGVSTLLADILSQRIVRASSVAECRVEVRAGLPAL